MPWYARLVAAALVAYALSPVDLVPDFIPVLGYVDDLVLIPLGVLVVRRLIPPVVMADCRLRAEEALRRGQPVSWAGAVIVIALWLTLAVGAIVLAGRRLWSTR